MGREPKAAERGDQIGRVRNHQNRMRVADRVVLRKPGHPVQRGAVRRGTLQLNSGFAENLLEFRVTANKKLKKFGKQVATARKKECGG